eukprot:SAG31_NODE_6833_length_1875_cov_1.606982_2_plen_57_part_00
MVTRYEQLLFERLRLLALSAALQELAQCSAVTSALRAHRKLIENRFKRMKHLVSSK